jgi:hypothetical protein
VMGMKVSNTKNMVSRAAQDLIPSFVIENIDLLVGSVLMHRKSFRLNGGIEL